VLAGVVASLIQVVVGKVEDKLFLPHRENADIAPRLVQRLAQRAGHSLPHVHKWVLGTIFHEAYSVFWGAAYGVAYAAVGGRRVVPWPVGGVALGTLLHQLAFSPWGAAVQTGTERPPHRRTWRMSVVTWSVALTYGLVTALVYERLSPVDGRDENDTAAAP
jgi:hypothetical protein